MKSAADIAGSQTEFDLGFEYALLASRSYTTGLYDLKKRGRQDYIVVPRAAMASGHRRAPTDHGQASRRQRDEEQGGILSCATNRLMLSRRVDLFEAYIRVNIDCMHRFAVLLTEVGTRSRGASSQRESARICP